MVGKYVQNSGFLISKYSSVAYLLFLLIITMASSAFAQDATTIATNVATSAQDLPGVIAAFAYLLGLIFGFRGVLKLKSHVENPGEGAGQTPLRTPIISFIVGGALFALPMLYDAAQNTIDGGGGFFTIINPLMGTVAAGLSAPFGLGTGADFNVILGNIAQSFRGIPGIISALAYLLGLALVFIGIIKVKEHVENPEQIKISEGVVRLLTGGALLALPSIFNAMFQTIDGTLGVSTLLSSGNLTTLLTNSIFINNNGGAAACVQGTGSFGQLICTITANTGFLPAFLTAAAYLFGVVMGVWGILKIRDHVLNPQQTTIFEGVSRLIAGGAFFALPLIVSVLDNTIANGGIAPGGGAGYNFTGAIAGTVAGIIGGGTCPNAAAGVGLDMMLVCLATDILGPIHAVTSFFAFVAGMVFIMIGISRLIKGAQEGAKAPGGLGTIMTFVIGGALISYNDLMTAATSTFTGGTASQTFATIQYTAGLVGPEVDAANAVVGSILKFMIVVGIISFVRGLFIIRNVAEGNQQASMMAGVTHIVGGALAVNLGSVLNAVQATMGIAGFGITFA